MQVHLKKNSLVAWINHCIFFSREVVKFGCSPFHKGSVNKPNAVVPQYCSRLLWNWNLSAQNGYFNSKSPQFFINYSIYYVNFLLNVSKTTYYWHGKKHYIALNRKALERNLINRSNSFSRSRRLELDSAFFMCSSNALSIMTWVLQLILLSQSKI